MRVHCPPRRMGRFDGECPAGEVRLPSTRECGDDGCDASHCCEGHCSAFSSCPTGTVPEDKECMSAGGGAQGDHVCSESNCCRTTCESTAAATCGAGQRFKDTNPFCERTSDNPNCAEDDYGCCEDIEYCCEDIPTPEEECGGPSPGEDSATYAAQFCWGVGGFDGSCPAGFVQKEEGNCHRSIAGGPATASDCCEASCGSLQGRPCPAGETFQPHSQVYGDESSFADSCCATMCSDR